MTCKKWPWRNCARIATVASVALLAGCATFSKDGGFEAVQSIAQERLGATAKWARSDADEDSVRAETKRVLSKPLEVSDAVQLALLNNRGLQATYAELGVIEADLVQASRLRNPSFGYMNVRRGAEHYNIERSLVFDVFQLLTMPLARNIEARRFEQTKLSVSGEMLELAAQTRRAYYAAVASQQSVKYFEQVKEAAEASAELARRMAAAGNFNTLQRAREQSFYAEAVAQLARARHAATADRERLTRLLGLWGEDLAFTLPERLPDLPTAPQERPAVEAEAMRTRLDLRAAKQGMSALADSLGLSKATRFLNVLELGPAQVREPDAIMNGYEIRLEIPIFDWGGARVRRAEALYMQAANRMAERAVNARSEVREAYASYRTNYALAKHYRDEIVPLRKRISDEQLLRYNGMLIGVFELLADAREQVASVNAAIEALREFWIADADLAAAQNGGSMSMGAMPARRASAMAARGEAMGH